GSTPWALRSGVEPAEQLWRKNESCLITLTFPQERGVIAALLVHTLSLGSINSIIGKKMSVVNSQPGAQARLPPITRYAIIGPLSTPGQTTLPREQATGLVQKERL